MSKFKLIPSISISENIFRDKFGKKAWHDLLVKLVHHNRFECQGCGKMYTTNDEWKKFSVHVISGDENEENINNLNTTLLCKACHFTQHFDKLAETGDIQLVNSLFSQEELIRIGRREYVNNERLYEQYIENNSIVLLSKIPADYAKEYLESTLNRSNKIKIIYRSKFNWE